MPVKIHFGARIVLLAMAMSCLALSGFGQHYWVTFCSHGLYWPLIDEEVSPGHAWIVIEQTSSGFANGPTTITSYGFYPKKSLQSFLTNTFESEADNDYVPGELKVNFDLKSTPEYSIKVEITESSYVEIMKLTEIWKEYPYNWYRKSCVDFTHTVANKVELIGESKIKLTLPETDIGTNADRWIPNWYLEDLIKLNEDIGVRKYAPLLLWHSWAGIGLDKEVLDKLNDIQYTNWNPDLSVKDAIDQYYFSKPCTVEYAKFDFDMDGETGVIIRVLSPECMRVDGESPVMIYENNGRMRLNAEIKHVKFIRPTSGGIFDAIGNHYSLTPYE